jgi:ribose-phosphate pyrophosphokinase
LREEAKFFTELLSMKPLVIAMPGETELGQALARLVDGDLAEREIRSFPDGESYIRIDSPVEGREVMIAGSLDDPNRKAMPLLYVAETARDLGAGRIGLVSPYLAYMRQDARFRPGEGVTSHYFGRLISSAFDWMITVDPHLHRHSGLDDIYCIPTEIVEAAGPIANWIKGHIEDPLLVGPDEESAQWVHAVAEAGGFSSIILEKIRHGDYDVEVGGSERGGRANQQPVLIDDIISTGRTMIEAVRHLSELQFRAPICIGIHGLFVEDARAQLEAAGIADLVTCNTVFHETNAIDIRPEVGRAVAKFLGRKGAASQMSNGMA